MNKQRIQAYHDELLFCYSDEEEIESTIKLLKEYQAEILETNTDALMKFSQTKIYNGVKRINLARICLDIDNELATKIKNADIGGDNEY